MTYPMPKMKPVLTLFEAGMKTEVFMLNVGDTFDGFGGSRTGLLVAKTASLITRRHIHDSISDHEFDITHAGFWTTLARVINAKRPDVRAEAAS